MRLLLGLLAGNRTLFISHLAVNILRSSGAVADTLLRWWPAFAILILLYYSRLG